MHQNTSKCIKKHQNTSRRIKKHQNTSKRIKMYQNASKSIKRQHGLVPTKHFVFPTSLFPMLIDHLRSIYENDDPRSLLKHRQPWHQLALSNSVTTQALYCTVLYYLQSFLFGAMVQFRPVVQFLHTLFEIGYIFHLS